MTALYENTYPHYADPEDGQPAWPKERRVMAVTPIDFGHLAVSVVDSIDGGGRCYTRKLSDPSTHRLQKLANNCFPEVNGLILNIKLTGGVQIIVTRPGWVEEA